MLIAWWYSFTAFVRRQHENFHPARATSNVRGQRTIRQREEVRRRAAAVTRNQAVGSPAYQSHVVKAAFQQSPTTESEEDML